MMPFTVVVPPEWVLVEPGSPADSVRVAVSRMLSGRSSADRAKAGPIIDAQLRSFTSELADRGFSALLLSTRPLDPRFRNPMVLVGPLSMSDDESSPLDMLVGLAGSDPSAVLLDLDGQVCVRVVRDVAASGIPPEVHEGLPEQLKAELESHPGVASTASAAAVGKRTRQIRYLLGVPGSDDKWADVLASLDVPPGPDGEQLGDAYTELTDALVMSFRWKD